MHKSLLPEESTGKVKRVSTKRIKTAQKEITDEYEKC